MKLLFYKAKHYGWLDRCVSLLTFGPYSHVVLLLNNGLAISSDLYTGVTISKNFKECPEHVDVIEPLFANEECIEYHARLLNGVAYDTFGAVCSYFGWQSDTKWYCSELIAYLLFVGQAYPKLMQRTNPNALFRRLISHSNFKLIRGKDVLANGNTDNVKGADIRHIQYANLQRRRTKSDAVSLFRLCTNGRTF